MHSDQRSQASYPAECLAIQTNFFIFILLTSLPVENTAIWPSEHAFAWSAIKLLVEAAIRNPFTSKFEKYILPTF